MPLGPKLPIHTSISNKLFYSSINKFSSQSNKIGTRLSNKVALITGGGSGIGRESSLLFASQGCKIIAADINENAAKETVKMIENLYGKNIAISAYLDVSKSKNVREVVEQSEKEFQKLNIIFNNAGIMHPDDDNAETTEDNVWDLTMNVNVKGVWYGCKYGISALRRAGGGSVINTASFVALRGAATPQLAYTTSKGAVLAMTRELAVIHAKEKIRFNSLCPGPLKTELLMKFLNTEQKRQRRLVHIPMGRFGEAKEMATAALFLASDDSSYMTGSELIVDGGLCAAYVTPE